MLKTIQKLIRQAADDMDKKIAEGNCNLSVEDGLAILYSLRTIVDKDITLSRTESARYLNMGVKNFDRLVKLGEIPPGIKKVGSTKFWTTTILDLYIDKKKQ